MVNQTTSSKIKKVTKKQVFIFLILLVIGFLAYLYFNKSPASPYEFVIVSKTNLIDEISVTGRVKPSQDTNLAFEKSGKISAVYVEVGDTVYLGQILASISNADLVANLSQAKANLETEEIRLDELKKGTRPEEIKISESKFNSAVISLEDAKNGLYNKIQDAYTKSDDAIKNKVDQFIYNAKTSSPVLSFSTNLQLKNDIETKRVSIGSLLASWKQSMDSIDQDKVNQAIEDSKNNLDEMNSFLNKVSNAVNELSPSSSISQSTIDTYKANVSTARTNVNTAKTNLLSAEEKLRSTESSLLIVENELLLKKAGATPEAILTQESKIRSARANVDNIEAQIAKTVIYSPITGIVTRQDFKAGEITSANVTSISLISKEKFKVEANIPEADIARVKIGNNAQITLDAYGDDELFEAMVATIDPAETMIEGVATYKTTLEFVDGNGKIKSGMTANIDILSSKKEGVLVIPARAINNRDGKKTVNILQEGADGETLIEVEIETGLKGSEGLVEITSGLDEGDKVVTFINK